MEINGMKFEVEQLVKETYTFKVGEKVKILKKDYSSFKVCFGMITGFDNFNGKAVITVAYLETSYNSAELKIEYITEESDIKLLPYNEDLDFRKENIVEMFDRQIKNKQDEIRKIEFEKDFFIKQFGKLIENK